MARRSSKTMGLAEIEAQFKGPFQVICEAREDNTNFKRLMADRHNATKIKEALGLDAMVGIFPVGAFNPKVGWSYTVYLRLSRTGRVIEALPEKARQMNRVSNMAGKDKYTPLSKEEFDASPKAFNMKLVFEQLASKTWRAVHPVTGQHIFAYGVKLQAGSDGKCVVDGADDMYRLRGAYYRTFLILAPKGIADDIEERSLDGIEEEDRYAQMIWRMFWGNKTLPFQLTGDPTTELINSVNEWKFNALLAADNFQTSYDKIEDLKPRKIKNWLIRKGLTYSDTEYEKIIRVAAAYQQAVKELLDWYRGWVEFESQRCEKANQEAANSVAVKFFGKKIVKTMPELPKMPFNFRRFKVKDISGYTTETIEEIALSEIQTIVNEMRQADEVAKQAIEKANKANGPETAAQKETKTKVPFENSKTRRRDKRIQASLPKPPKPRKPQDEIVYDDNVEPGVNPMIAAALKAQGLIEEQNEKPAEEPKKVKFSDKIKCNDCHEMISVPEGWHGQVECSMHTDKKHGRKLKTQIFVPANPPEAEQTTEVAEPFVKEKDFTEQLLGESDTTLTENERLLAEIRDRHSFCINCKEIGLNITNADNTCKNCGSIKIIRGIDYTALASKADEFEIAAEALEQLVDKHGINTVEALAAVAIFEQFRGKKPLNITNVRPLVARAQQYLLERWEAEHPTETAAESEPLAEAESEKVLVEA